MNTIDFHISTGKELIAIKDRVRHLIDHWGEDGRYKEAVLKSTIQRFLPEKYKIVTGFVVRPTNTRGTHKASKQIDLIIYDTRFPVLFKENDFAIVTPDSVRAIIEVKANIKNQGIEGVVRKANELGQFIHEGKQDQNIQFFNGVFSYAGYERLNIDRPEALTNALVNSEGNISNLLHRNRFKVNHICFNNDWFYKYWLQNDNSDGGYLYHIKDLSFAFFISNLMNYLQDQPMFNDSNLWFPVDKDIISRRLIH